MAQTGRAATALAALGTSQRERFSALLDAAPTDAHRQLLLKALAAREDRLGDEALEEITRFAETTRAMSHDEIVTATTFVRPPDGDRVLGDVGPGRQHFTMSCGPTVALIALAEADPITAMALRDPDTFRERQRQLMDEAGGGATLRDEVHLGAAIEASGSALGELIRDSVARLAAGDASAIEQLTSSDIGTLRRYAQSGVDARGRAGPSEDDARTAARNLYDTLRPEYRASLGISSPDDLLRRVLADPAVLDTSAYAEEDYAPSTRRQALAHFAEGVFTGPLAPELATGALEPFLLGQTTSISRINPLFDALRPELRDFYLRSVEGEVSATADPGARRGLAVAQFQRDVRGLLSGSGGALTPGREAILRAVHDASGTATSFDTFAERVMLNTGSRGTTLDDYLDRTLLPATGADYREEPVGQLGPGQLGRLQEAVEVQGLDVPIRVAAADGSRGMGARGQMQRTLNPAVPSFLMTNSVRSQRQCKSSLCPRPRPDGHLVGSRPLSIWAEGAGSSTARKKRY